MSGSVSLPDPVVTPSLGDRGAETRIGDQNEGDVLETLGDYKCDPRMSVENVNTVVNIRTLSLHSSMSQSQKYFWTKKLNTKDDGVDKYWVLLEVVKE